MIYRLFGAVLLLLLLTLPLSARNAPLKGRGISNPRVGAALPTRDYLYHDVGNIWLTVSNWGFLGNPDETSMPYYPSCEYPANTDLDFLFQAGPWFGAIVGPGSTAQSKRDTLVSEGLDGWLNAEAADQYEFYPGSDPGDTIKKYSNRNPGVPDSNWTAKSEQDFIADYFDYKANLSGPDHQPMGVHIIQTSYAWSYSFSDDFVLVHYEIINEGFQDGTYMVLTKGWLGIYCDCDTGPNWNTAYNGCAQDDVAGFWMEAFTNAKDQADTLKFGFIQDANPSGGDTDPNWPAGYWKYKGGNTDAWHNNTIISVFVVGDPMYEKQKAATDTSLDWWSKKRRSQLTYAGIDTSTAYRNDKKFQRGAGYKAPPMDKNGMVTCWNWWISAQEGKVMHDESPMGDGEKYRRLSNGQNDFFDAGAYKEEGKDAWTNAPQDSTEDTRFLISYGQFEPIKKNDRLSITIAVICGLNRLALVENAKWAKNIYINDYVGPQPPDPSPITLVGGNGKVDIYWDNTSENCKDPISGVKDFKGYHLWHSRTGLVSDYQLLGTWTMKINPNYKWEKSGDTYKWNGQPKGTWTGGNKPPIDPKTGKYVFTDTPVLNGFMYYYALTAFDWGMSKGTYGGEPQDVLPLESSVNAMKKTIIPGNTHSSNIDDIYVFPNPYRADMKYRDDGFESEHSEFGRRVVFCNLPKKCIIRIFTLSGELVRKIKHEEGLGTTQATHDWDLMNMNKIAVSSGIYLYAVESLSTDKPGKKIGKLVIIR